MIHEKKLKRSQEAHEEEVLEHDRSVKGLPTMQALLDNGLIKQRTPEETELLKQQRILNRKPMNYNKRKHKQKSYWNYIMLQVNSSQQKNN